MYARRRKQGTCFFLASVFSTFLFSHAFGQVSSQEPAYWNPLNDLISTLGGMYYLTELCSQTDSEEKLVDASPRLSIEKLMSIKEAVLSKEELKDKQVQLLDQAFEEGQKSYESMFKHCDKRSQNMLKSLKESLADKTRYLLQTY